MFDQMAGRYNQTAGPNLGVYLKGHAGDLLKVDRRGRQPEYVERPCLTIGLTVQPDVLQGLASRPGSGDAGYWLGSCTASREPGRPTPSPALRPFPSRSPTATPWRSSPRRQPDHLIQRRPRGAHP